MKKGDRVQVMWIDESGEIESENQFKVVRVIGNTKVVLRMIPGPHDEVPPGGDCTFVRRGEFWHEFDSDTARAKITVHKNTSPRPARSRSS